MTPYPSVDLAPAPADPSSAARFIGWFAGVPLRVALIVVIAAIALAVLHRLVRSMTGRVARGAMSVPSMSRRREADEPATLLAVQRRAQRAHTIGSVLRSTVTVLVGTIGTLLVLDALGVNIAPLLASAGIVGVAIGFGAQSLVRDTLTGLFMLMEDQYGVGDVVDVGAASGTVEAVGLRVTKLRDADGTLWYVPNGSMIRVGNKTQGWSTAVVELQVDYFADLDEVQRLLRAAAARVVADPDVVADILGEPTVTGVEKLSSDAITLQLRVRTAPARQWEVARHLRVAARSVLEEAGVPLAGQRDRLAERRALAAKVASVAADEAATVDDPVGGEPPPAGPDKG